MERHFCRLAEQSLDVFRVLQAGKLNHDAVGALTLDNRFFGSQLVDTASDNFDGLVNDFEFELIESRVVVFDFKRVIVKLVDNQTCVYFLNRPRALLRLLRLSILTLTDSFPALRF